MSIKLRVGRSGRGKRWLVETSSWGGDESCAHLPCSILSPHLLDASQSVTIAGAYPRTVADPISLFICKARGTNHGSQFEIPGSLKSTNVRYPNIV